MTPRLNPSIATLSAPPIPVVQGWGRAYDGARGPLIDLSQAVPGYPPHPRMLRWLADAAASPEACAYGAIEGEDSLRAAYAGETASLYGATISARNIHITSGCNQAFVVASMAVAGPGDRVVLTNPCYFNHETTLAMQGIGVDYVTLQPETGFLPDPARVAAALTPGRKALALVSPNNPTGAVYPPPLLKDLFDLCAARGVWLILDETYRDFLPDAGAPHGLFAEPRWADTLIGLYSFSKSFCIPGHRVAAITAGEPVVEAVAKIMDNVQICAPRAAQMALAKALPALADWRAENRAEIARRRVALIAAVAQNPDWQIGAIGAYFAFLRHPWPERTSLDVAQQLATQNGIITIPGRFFGADQDEWLRLAFANADAPTLATLADRLRD